MSELSQGPGWWQASDGKWYSPQQHPDYRAPWPPPQAWRNTTPGAGAWRMCNDGIWRVNDGHYCPNDHPVHGPEMYLCDDMWWTRQPHENSWLPALEGRWERLPSGRWRNADSPEREFRSPLDRNAHSWIAWMATD